MSSPATPKGVELGSESHLQSPLSNILTPSRKVKALLAQFDDETDSEAEPQKKISNPVRPRNPTIQQTLPDKLLETARDASSDGDDDEDLPVMPRGRMAARMQAQQQPDMSFAKSGSTVQDDAHSRLQAQTIGAKENHSDKSASSLDDQVAAPRRRLLKKKQKQARDSISPRRAARSISPMFFSPNATQQRLQKSDGTSSDGATSGGDDLPDNLLDDKPNSRFLKLVEEHRKRRQEKEAMEVEKRNGRIQQLRKHSQASSSVGRSVDVGSSSEEDNNAEDRDRTMPQSRPTRGASKKAIEEMRREQQRISRNMQLAHQAQTKKKVTKESLLAKFNFLPPAAEDDTIKPLAPVTSSSAPASDTEGRQVNDTPPTSPVSMDNADERSAEKTRPGQADETTVQKMTNGEEPELAIQDSLLSERVLTIDKGKGKAVEQDSEEVPAHTFSPEPESKPMVRPIRIQLSKDDIFRKHPVDDELDIVASESPINKTRKFKVFERIPKTKAQETPSHLLLRSFAHLNAPKSGRSKQVQTVTSAEMESALRRQARLQAVQERTAKIEELKAKGIIVQSTEEREKEQQEVEDLLEKARQEGADIAKQEKELAKKNGETVARDGLDDSEDEDEEDGDFTDDDDMQDEAGSASGEDDDNVDEDEVGEEGASDEDAQSMDRGDPNALIEQEAEEQGSDEESAEEVTDDASDPGNAVRATPAKLASRSRKSRVISDDEDRESEDQATEKTKSATKTPQSILRSTKKHIPGLPMSDDLPMGLSQAFAATMADSQPGNETQAEETQEPDSLTMLRDMPMPEPEIPIIPHFNRLESLHDPEDSQAASETQPLSLDLSFTQPRDLRRRSIDASAAGISSTQFSELPPEPTQDVGYILSPWTERRFDTPQQPPQSTVETIALPQDESPLKERKRRLRRRQPEAEGAKLAEVAEAEDNALEDNEKYLIDPSAFDVMRRASARLRDHQSLPADTEKAKAEAKNMVEEAAEESEDEYAGLGGASDDDVGEEEEEDRMMIDDEGREKLNERLIAKLHADKERTNDQAAVSKLLKDITTGALRRKRGAGDDLDLSDEEDAFARRIEAKRREFAKMRRELLKSDERIEKIAEDPRKMAFLKAIEDRDYDEEAMEGGNDESEDPEVESQSQETPVEPPRHPSAAKIGSVLGPALPSTTNRLPAPRRSTIASKQPHTGVTAPNKKPASLNEIRESLSFLIEEPDSQTSGAFPPSPPSSSESELDDHDEGLDGKENESEDDDDMADFIVEDSQPSAAASEKANAVFKKPPVPPPRLPGPQRRTKPIGAQRTDVVDRLSLLRQRSSSSTGSAAGGGGSRMAFMRSSSSGGDFQVPSLLRRTTTHSSFGSDVSTSASAATERQTADEGKKRLGVKMKMTGNGKRGAVNFRAKPIGAANVNQRGGKRTGAGKMKGSVSGAGGPGGFLKGFLGGGGSGGSWD